jgi:Fe2+ or Zn2+ uptake regulation protein
MVSQFDIAELLRRHNLRVTPQRRAILQAFHGAADEHLSADEVISRASVAVPEIGRGTVYATLAEFAELGVLASVGHPEPIRYETNIAPHDHFRCRLCMRLFDVNLGGDELARRPLDTYTIESACAESLERYFGGSQAPASDMIDRRLLSDAQANTLTSVQQIPYAQPCSYSRLASDLDPYAIGHLMGSNPVPLLVPCHRVSCGSDRPQAYVGGADNLHVLQALEAR